MCGLQVPMLRGWLTAKPLHSHLIGNRLMVPTPTARAQLLGTKGLSQVACGFERRLDSCPGLETLSLCSEFQCQAELAQEQRTQWEGECRESTLLFYFACTSAKFWRFCFSPKQISI